MFWFRNKENWAEKNDIISKLSKEKKMKKNKQYQIKKWISQYKLDLNNINNLFLKNQQKIIELKENQNELKNKIQQDKLIDLFLSFSFHENGSLPKYY